MSNAPRGNKAARKRQLRCEARPFCLSSPKNIRKNPWSAPGKLERYLRSLEDRRVKPLKGDYAFHHFLHRSKLSQGVCEILGASCCLAPVRPSCVFPSDDLSNSRQQFRSPLANPCATNAATKAASVRLVALILVKRDYKLFADSFLFPFLFPFVSTLEGEDFHGKQIFTVRYYGDSSE